MRGPSFRSHGHVSLRRPLLSFPDPAYASGGFISDTRIEQKLISGSQQQWITRNSAVGTWDGSVWNQFFLGVEGAPDDSTYPDPAFTVIAQSPITREKPFLYESDMGYFVNVPSMVTKTRGISWYDRLYTPGISYSLSEFFVAHPTDSVETLNKQIARGKNLLLTPGVYEIAESILVNRAETVILGMGLASLTSVNGSIPIKIGTVPGVVVAGLTIDAGLDLSPVLLQVGEKNATSSEYSTSEFRSNPITLSDIYFRVGGPHIGKTEIALEVNANHVLIDHTWVWRADHGVENFNSTDGFDGDNVRWATNTGLNGVVVNGDDVTITGLFVEHFQQYNVVWNGERGRVYFFQNELPYEPKNQGDWTASDGTLGWAAYKVDESVKKHELWAGGVYCYNRNDNSVVTTDAFQVPETSGVVLNRVMTNVLSSKGSILSVVNGCGSPVSSDSNLPSYVLRYPPNSTA